MGIRFRKRMGLLGGLCHLNFSLTGISLSLGPRGANVNLGGVNWAGNPRPQRFTIGAPGTGIFYQRSWSAPTRQSVQQKSAYQPNPDYQPIERGILGTPKKEQRT